MHRACVYFCYVLLASDCLATERWVDPVEGFLKERALRPTDVLLRIDMDVDGDGKPEAYLSLERFANGKEGNLWSVFVQGKDGYSFVGGCDFSPNLFYVGYIKELHRRGLINYWPAGTQDGLFIAYTFRGTSIVETDMGHLRNLKTPRKRRAYSKELFGDGPPFTLPYEVKRIPVTELAQKYHLQISNDGS